LGTVSARIVFLASGGEAIQAEAGAAAESAARMRAESREHGGRFPVQSLAGKLRRADGRLVSQPSSLGLDVEQEEFGPAEGRDELGDVRARAKAGTEIARSRARHGPSGRAFGLGTA